MSIPTYINITRDGVINWLASIRFKANGWGRWPYNKHMARPYGLIPSGLAVKILDLLGELPRVSLFEKTEAVNFIQSQQDPVDGYFKDELVNEGDRVAGLAGCSKHSWEDIWNQMNSVATSLDLLGGSPLYPLPVQSFANLKVVDIREWVRNLGWENPWHVGERFHRAIAAYLRQLPGGASLDHDPILQFTFECFEHDVLNYSTGFPELLGCDNKGVAMAGLFKVMFAYRAAERAFPLCRQALDSTIALQLDTGEFASPRNMCLNWDALWLLRELDRDLEGKYRYREVQTAGNRLATCLLKNYRKSDGGFAFCREHCWPVHHSVRVSDPLPESDMMGTWMSLLCLKYADEWNASTVLKTTQLSMTNGVHKSELHQLW